MTPCPNFQIFMKLTIEAVCVTLEYRKDGAWVRKIAALTRD